MVRDLTELLDPELKGPIKMMLSQMPPTDFNDIPAARAAEGPDGANFLSSSIILPESEV